MQINIAQLSEATLNERIDSQFFRADYVNSFRIVSNREYSLLSEIAHITDGNHLKVSRPEEFHLQPLADPDRNVPAHPAPII